MLAASFNPLHRGHAGLLAAAQDIAGRPGCYELSIENVDKPRLSEPELRSRLLQFAGLAPVMVTNAPTFVEKSRLAPGSVFVTGVDTAERLFVDQYYDREDCSPTGPNYVSPTAGRTERIAQERLPDAGGRSSDGRTRLRDP